MRIFSGVLVITAGIALAACGGSGNSTTSTPASTSRSATQPATGFGVPECDDYLTKYEACISGKVPESARALVRQQLDATKASWQQAASTPEGKAGLATGCKMATDAARTAMQAYGCAF
jgi:hypothetical protein